MIMSVFRILEYFHGTPKFFLNLFKFFMLFRVDVCVESAEKYYHIFCYFELVNILLKSSSWRFLVGVAICLDEQKQNFIMLMLLCVSIKKIERFHQKV